jgi:hypothetical protein
MTLHIVTQSEIMYEIVDENDACISQSYCLDTLLNEVREHYEIQFCIDGDPLPETLYLNEYEAYEGELLKRSEIDLWNYVK